MIMDVMTDVGDQLRKDGIFMCRHLLDSGLIEHIKQQVDRCFQCNIYLGQARNIANLKPEHLTMYGQQLAEIEKQYNHFYLDDMDFALGVDSYKHMTNGRSVVDPLCNLDRLDEIVFNPILRDVVSAYFEEESKLGFVKVRRDFVNDLPCCDASNLHVDDNSDKFLKAVIFLNDITTKDGPFYFVPGSHKNPIPSDFCGHPNTRTEEEILSYYGSQHIVGMDVKVGDVVFADTLGIHKGGKPIKNDRSVLFINFVVEEEYGGKGAKTCMPKALFDSLISEDKQFAQFAVRV